MLTPKEALPLEDGAEVTVTISERGEPDRDAAWERLARSLHEASKEANPDFVWSRDLAYDE